MKAIQAEDIPLVPFGDFKKAARKIVSITKKESDRELAETHASNVRRRAAKKRP